MNIDHTLRTFSVVLAIAALPCTGCLSESEVSLGAVEAPQIESEQILQL